MSTRTTSIAIGLALAAVLCVCMLALAALGSLFFLGFFAAMRPVSLTAVPPFPPPMTATPLPTQTSDDMNVEMDAIEQQVKDIRGWQSTQSVPRNFYDNEQLRDYNIKSFEEDYSPEEARDDVLSLAAFALIDPSFDLYNFYIDLYSEDILGFYDPDVAELFIITERGAMGAVERSTFAHEYLHALQDQTHGFDALGWNDDAYDEDAQRFGALQALMEGEATLLESLWQEQYFTQADWDDYYANAYADPDSAYFRAPEWLQKDFYFPYDQGYQFAKRLYDRGGWEAVNAAYEHLPISTEMILHPDKYDDYEQPAAVPAPPILDALGPDWRVVDTNSQGEWYTTLILEQYILDGAAEAAAGWGGDRYAVAYNDSTGETAAAWHLVWDTTSDAEEFVDAFQEYGDARFGVSASIGEGSLCWSNGGADSCLFFSPQSTLWILAPDAETVEQIRSVTDF